MPLSVLRPFSIRWKLTLIILFVATAVSLLQIILFVLYDARAFLDYKKSRVHVVADIIGTNVTPALVFRNRDDAAEILASLHASETFQSGYLFDDHGALLAQYVQ